MSTYTLTFGDQAENHVGMQQIGKLAEEGFTITELCEAQQRFQDDGYQCEMVQLGGGEAPPTKKECKTLLGGNNLQLPEAAVLIIRDAVYAFVDPDALYDEQEELEYDTKAFMYGRVVNKHARHNICFADFSQEPDYANKKGRIVAFQDVPLLETVIADLPGYFGEKAANLTVEGNYYYDITKCGIGFHGDSERRKVIAIRLGETAPLHYQWYKDGSPIGERVVLSIGHGDMYVMSEKATGWDWKRKKDYTLRHAAGCEKYTQ